MSDTTTGNLALPPNPVNKQKSSKPITRSMPRPKPKGK